MVLFSSNKSFAELNIRAVPLADEGDVHQGRVFVFRMTLTNQ
jgi:hypothetical protein